jgi:hypothetical protein
MWYLENKTRSQDFVGHHMTNQRLRGSIVIDTVLFLVSQLHKNMNAEYGSQYMLFQVSICQLKVYTFMRTTS